MDVNVIDIHWDFHHFVAVFWCLTSFVVVPIGCDA